MNTKIFLDTRIEALKHNGNLLDTVSEGNKYAQFKWTPGNNYRVSFRCNNFSSGTDFTLAYKNVSYAVGAKQCFGNLNEALMYAYFIYALCKNSKSIKPGGYIYSYKKYYRKIYVIDTDRNRIISQVNLFD